MERERRSTGRRLRSGLLRLVKKETVKIAVGTLLGIAGGLNLGWIIFAGGGTPSSSTAKTFQYEGQRQVFRTEQPMEADAIYVETESGTGEYITLSKYLDSFENKYDRTVEKAKIEKLVDW